MKFTVCYDQRFAVTQNLTLTEVNCLTACFSLTIWSESYRFNDKTWYWYSEEKMCEDFPLLFGNTKRVYKNLKILADKGLIFLSNIDKRKVLSFTDKCASWNDITKYTETENGLNVEQKKNESPKTDYNETENGLQRDRKRTKCSPKTDYNETENGLQDKYINNNNINYKDNIDYKEEVQEENGFSSPNPDSETGKFSKEFGLTPEDLNVNPATVNKIDAAFRKLVFPFDDTEIKRLFFILCCQPKWKTKTLHALQMSLNKLQNYDSGFAKKLIEDCIAGGWQGLVFEDTDKKYEAWVKSGGDTGVDKFGFKKMTPEQLAEHDYWDKFMRGEYD